jgi:hypothetical protein
MSFDWIGFLNRYQLPWVDKGRNVSSGNVAVPCPYCGADDPSQHMTIALDGSGWRCWRNYEHRGKAPRRLVQALLRCSADEAAAIVGSRVPELQLDEVFVAETLAAMNGRRDEPEPERALAFMPEMKPLRPLGMGRYFFDYLAGRGYSYDEAVEAVHRYGLRYATKGPFRYRLIFPITLDGKLVNWTGRSLGPAIMRYRTLSTDLERSRKAGLPPAVKPVSQLLWNFDRLLCEGGYLLVITEGPFDAMRVDFLGAPYGIRATCIFGLGNGQGAQLLLLDRLAKRFKQTALLLDATAALDAVALQTRLSHLRPRMLMLPKGLGDPAELSKASFGATFALHV